MAGYKIVLADEHKMMLEGVQNYLESISTIQLNISAVFTSGNDLIDFIRQNSVNIVITEINFPGFQPDELITSIKKADKNIKVIVLSAYGDINLVKSCFRSGADGYLLKSSKFDSIKDSLNMVVQDKIFIGENLKVAPDLNDAEVGKELEKKKFPVDRFVIRQSLTKRELEILGLICAGYSNKMIADDLYISEHTASVHRKHLLRKIGVVNSQELTEFVKEFNILI
ncbi:MAG: LuxR C-terminal-related transcriptional regulator [Deltaproteobacteria bacterium]